MVVLVVLCADVGVRQSTLLEFIAVAISNHLSQYTIHDIFEKSIMLHMKYTADEIRSI